MAFTLQPFLFKLEEVDARSDLDRLRLVLEAGLRASSLSDLG